MKRIYEGKRSLDCWWPDGYHVREHRIVDADITMLCGNVVTSVDRERLKITSMQRTTLEGTPHYQYALGNKDVYIDYLNSLKHVTWARAAINQEHLDIQFMLDKFDKILYCEEDYLAPPYENKYIICDMSGLLRYGLHRAVTLLSNSVKRAPVAIVR